MIQKTVYFRTQEDLDKFNAINNKTQWLHEQLNPNQLLDTIRQHSVPKRADIQVGGANLCEHFQFKGQCMVKGCKYGRGTKK